MQKGKILFIQKQFVLLGIKYLSAMLKQHHYEARVICYDDVFDRIEYHIFRNKQLLNKFKTFLLHTIKKEAPDIIGFSSSTSNHIWNIEIANFLKEHFTIPIIFGGYHTTMAPDYVIKQPAVDMICVGEGEGIITKLMDTIVHHKDLTKIENIWFKKDGKIIKNAMAPLIQDLDSLPFLDTSFDINSSNTYYILGSRGCPYQCTYCCNNYLKSIYRNWGKVRFRSVEKIIEEIEMGIKKQGKISLIEFMDDIFAISNDRIKKLGCTINKRFNLPYSILISPNLINEEGIKILKDTNCSLVRFGLQTANEDIRKIILKRTESNEKVKNIADWCHKYGLDFSIDHIFYLPGETKENLIESLRFYNEIRPTFITFGSLIYLPGTEIIDIGIQKGLISESDRDLIYEGKHYSATESHLKRIAGSSGKNKTDAAFINKVAYTFSLISFKSQDYVNTLINSDFFKSDKNISLLRIVLVKIIAKFYTKQFYIFRNIFKNIFVAIFRKSYYIN